MGRTLKTVKPRAASARNTNATGATPLARTGFSTTQTKSDSRACALITITKMAQTSYRIDFRGHTWWTSDTDTVEKFAQQGAEVTATTMTDTQIPGIAMHDLSEDQLHELQRIAQDNEWTYIERMAKDWRQQEMEQ